MATSNNNAERPADLLRRHLEEADSARCQEAIAAAIEALASQPVASTEVSHG